MIRLFLAILLGIVGAGIVHIAVLLLLPHYTDRDAWTQLAASSNLYEATRIDSGSASAAPLLRSSDPLFSAVACRFDLADGPVHVSAEDVVPFWSMSIYDRRGQNIFSFNDRTVSNHLVDFVVLTAAQTIELRKDLPSEVSGSVFVEADIDEGIVVVRSFVADASWQSSIASFLEGVDCSPL